MFSIFKQFRASNALDNPGRASVPSESDEFSQLDKHLRSSAPPSPSADGLHEAIIRAVKAASTSVAPAGAGWGWSWAWAGPSLAVTAACVALAVWSGLKGVTPGVPSVPSGPRSMTAASTAVELSGSWTATFPAALTSPMTDELDRLNQDIAATTRTLLATLP